MKKYLSVFMLFVKSSLLPFFGILLLLFLFQTGLFKLCLEKAMAERALMENPYPLGFEGLIAKSRLILPFGAAFVLLSFFLSKFGCDLGAKPSYTLKRLRIEEQTIFLVQFLHNTLFYFLLLGAQTLFILFLFRLYTQAAQPGWFSGQSLFLAFYRSEFLHALFPMDSRLFHVRNLFLCLSMGALSARFPYAQRRGHFSLLLPLFMALLCFNFSADLSAEGNGVLLIAASIYALFHVFVHVFAKEEVAGV